MTYTRVLPTAHHELASCLGLRSESKRIIAGNEPSYPQQIQGGQQIGEESSAILGQIGELYLSLGEFEKAIELSRQCLDG